MNIFAGILAVVSGMLFISSLALPWWGTLGGCVYVLITVGAKVQP